MQSIFQRRVPWEKGLFLVLAITASPRTYQSSLGYLINKSISGWEFNLHIACDLESSHSASGLPIQWPLVHTPSLRIGFFTVSDMSVEDYRLLGEVLYTNDVPNYTLQGVWYKNYLNIFTLKTNSSEGQHIFTQF